MQGPDFLYFLTNDKNQFYYVNGTQVLLSGIPKQLTFTPDGWQDISIFFERNKKYFAIDRSFTIPLNFVEDGARILKHLFYNVGVESQCYLIIAEQVLEFDGIEYGFSYQKMYKGQIDFSTFQHVGPKVTVNVMEGDLVKLIKAYENTDYEIPVDTDDAVKIRMDGLSLQETGNFSIVDGLEIKKSVFGEQWFLPVNYNQSDGKSTGILFSTQNIQDVTSLSWADKLALTNDLATGNEAISGSVNAEIKGLISFKCTVNDPGLGFRCRFIRSNLSIPDQNIYQVFTSGPVPGNTYTFAVDMTVPLQPGERLFLEGIYFGGITGSIDIGIEFLDTSYLHIKYKNTYKETIIKAFTPYQLLQKLIEKITNGKYSVTSSLLQNHLTMITSGDAIRSLSGAVIKTSLLKLFKLFDLQEDAAMGIKNNQLFFETKQYWFDETEIIDIGSVANFKALPAADYLFSTIKIGYPNQNYNQALGDVNGKLEPNVTQTYSTGITCVQKELDLTTDIRADMYGIEFTRINLEGKTTTDGSSDNDTFAIRCAPNPVDGVYALDRSLNPYASIVVDPSYNMDAATQADLIGAFDQDKAFNLALTPKECLLNKNGAFIRGCLRKMEGGYITYNVSDKYPLLKVTPPTGRVVYERADVLIGDLDAPYFTAVQFEFETKVPIALQDVLNINPIQAFRFEYQGATMIGINIKIGMQPAIQKSQVWQLLSVPENDLSQLIEVWK